jgi:hypothetical protein
MSDLWLSALRLLDRGGKDRMELGSLRRAVQTNLSEVRPFMNPNPREKQLANTFNEHASAPCSEHQLVASSGAPYYLVPSRRRSYWRKRADTCICNQVRYEPGNAKERV